MFSTFTGNSRRPRNVNLSGQRNTNPWAATNTWGPGSSGSQAAVVANAQAERERRHREREELAASKHLQRVWRGHRDRKITKAQHRTEWDALYRNTSIPQADRTKRALPLLLSFFKPDDSGDQHRLDLYIQELGAFESWELKPYQENKLASLLVSGLERRSTSSSQHLLDLLVQLIQNAPYSILDVLHRYYKILAEHCKQSTKDGRPGKLANEQRRISDAITTPLLQGPNDQLRAYEAFAFSFLATPNLPFLDIIASHVAPSLDLQLLSRGIVKGFGVHSRRNSRDQLLWLLAHFIALDRVSPTVQGTEYVQALYTQLTELSDEIRLRSSPHEDNEDVSDDDSDEAAFKAANPLPPYVIEQMEFLVNEEGINDLLTRFTSSAASSARMSHDASLLAGYTLILLRCFPSHGDDIKMRLFQGDISTIGPTGERTLPCVKFFWEAACRTSIFTSIVRNRSEQRSKAVIALFQPDDPLRNQEWRTMLLFLELYNFLLRVTDDEDFLPASNEVVGQQSPAVVRIRSSGLKLTELKDLVHFLKTLTFCLYYNLSDIMPSTGRPTGPSVSSLFGTSSAATSDHTEPGPSASFAGIVGVDVLTLRSSATATMRSLYERDSRRPFLPTGFWLMTSKFDMDGFLSAVVLEEQRKQEAEQEEDEEMSDADVDRLDSFHTASGHRISRAAQIERHRQYKRIQREKLLAQIGPKLEILRNMPFTIPFEVRVQIFRQFVHLDKMKRRGGYVDPDQWRLSVLNGDMFAGVTNRGREILGRHSATIKRGQVFDDAYEQFYSLGEGLKEPIQITFVDQFGQPEAGIDGGGVTKEFLISVTSEAFSPQDHGLFVANSQNLLYPNPTAFDERAEELRYFGYQEGSPEWANGIQELSKHYEFLGRVVGKCMYEGILIDIAFASFFLLKWASGGQSSAADFRASLNDLRDLDPDLYKGLINLKNYPGDVTDLALDFTITDRITNPQTKEVRTVTRLLRRDGENIPVTNKDRPLYISYVAHHRLVSQPFRQTKAFLRGLGSIINPSWLSMFNQSELQRLVGGDSSEIDVEDLRRNTQYSGLYAIGDDGLEHPTVQMFWEVMHSLKDDERREVLKYVTSTPRAPLLGFSQLSPHFSIRDGGTDEERLPSTSTCVNLLKLPRYTNLETLRSKLLYAIQSGAGFDLS
ncbi:HECT-domain-containing protein [Xylariales sp. PMI_506]|nr:HECT-domain-containing protein [Xylariales sp. PMI_506]